MHTIAVQTESIFQALADGTRLRIVRLMVMTGEETCLCELAETLREPPYKLSRHLKILRQAGLLLSKKEGRWVYYRLAVEPTYLTRLYATVQALPDALNDYHHDLQRFHRRGRCREDATYGEPISGAG